MVCTQMYVCKICECGWANAVSYWFENFPCGFWGWADVMQSEDVNSCKASSQKYLIIFGFPHHTILSLYSETHLYYISLGPFRVNLKSSCHCKEGISLSLTVALLYPWNFLILWFIRPSWDLFWENFQ